MLKVGLLINPIAGIGGLAALKGSDGVEVQTLAGQMGGRPRSGDRAVRMLQAAGEAVQECDWITWGGAMGEGALVKQSITYRCLGVPMNPCDATDTIRAARKMREEGVDLLIFCGGDGTARDIFEAVGGSIVVLGVPAGVKMHSGVFASTPEVAGELLARLIRGGMVSSVDREVKDLDERALREGELRPRHFGELQVPEIGGFLQHTKEGGRENESLR